jgi:Domain of unknown function (DUF4132)
MTENVTRRIAAVALLKAFRVQAAISAQDWKTQPADLATGKAILAADPATQIAVIHASMTGGASQTNWYARQIESRLLGQLARRKLPYTEHDVVTLLESISTFGQAFYRLPVQALLQSVKAALIDPAWLEACRPALEKIRDETASVYSSADQRKLLKLIDEILRGQAGEKGPLTLPVDEWSAQVAGLLDSLDAVTRDHWETLLRACIDASGSAPSGKWLASAHSMRTTLGIPTFLQLATDWLGVFRHSSNKPPDYSAEEHELISNGCLLDEDNANLLRGLAWLCADLDDSALAATLADTAIAGYRKISGVGPRSAKVAGACVYALKNMPGLYAAAQLERLRLNVKQASYLKGIESALNTAAERAGLSREDLVEMTVPTFDLAWRAGDGGSARRVALGSAVAELAITGADVLLRWYDASGSPRKSEPADVKRDHKAELKELKRLRDDIAHMLTAQRDRLERLPLAQRSWPLPAWRERYLDHPLIGNLARRLIWRFTWKSEDGVEGVNGDERTEDGIWLDGRLVRSDDTPLDVPDTATVMPWHPVGLRADAVLAWRDWLDRHQLTQPFKQAHREVYVLTDAERATRVYSNRFAAHILRQHQFNALCAARGWRNTLRLAVDAEYPPATLDLPLWDLRAEFWVEGAGHEYGVDTNTTGTYLYLSTDQVRFYRLGATAHYAHAGGGGYFSEGDWRRGDESERQEHAPVRLEEIPPLILSEVLRDVDLFVGVASVGNDPTWQDGGPQGRYRDYWQSYSFGELSATAETRKHLLQRLIPRLTIADRCAIDGRFLIVRGDLRTYKIHFGSGNILMQPNDQYLCIVQSRGTGNGASSGELFLPFEGDSTLALILSKAFLLADDTAITDPTITRQIGAR